ncbi:hypothetical protein [Caldimonas sp. KR1-144]
MTRLKQLLAPAPAIGAAVLWGVYEAFALTRARWRARGRAAMLRR